MEFPKFSWPFRWKYTGYLVDATPLTVFHQLFWNFLDVFCMWFWYNPLIIFSHFFCFVNLVFFRYEMLSKHIDSGYLVGATYLTLFHPLFRNIADVFSMEWRCACGFGIILLLFFLTFSALWTWSFFLVWYYAIKVYRQWVPCGRNSSYSFPPIVLKLCRCFLHGMKMCMWFLV